MFTHAIKEFIDAVAASVSSLLQSDGYLALLSGWDIDPEELQIPPSQHDVTSIDIGFDISDTSRLSEFDEEIIRLHCECGELQVGM